MNTLLVINGIQGSGKTSLGDLLSARKDFAFVKLDKFYETVPRVDKTVEWFADLEYKKNVYSAFKDAIKSEIKNGNVIIEATGIGDKFNNILEELRKEDLVMKKIFLEIDKDTAQTRVFARNSTDHPIKVSSEDLEYIVSKIHEVDLTDAIVIKADQSLEDIYLEACKGLNI